MLENSNYVYARVLPLLIRKTNTYIFIRYSLNRHFFFFGHEYSTFSQSRQFYLQKYITYLRTRRVTISNVKNDDLRISRTASDWLSKSYRRPIAARQMSWLCGLRTIVHKKNVLPLKWQCFWFFFLIYWGLWRLRGSAFVFRYSKMIRAVVDSRNGTVSFLFYRDSF